MDGGTPLSARVCDRFVVAYAAWTLVCHAVVMLLGGSLETLLAASWLVPAAVLAWWLLERRAARAPRAEPGAADAQEPGSPPATAACALAAALALAGAAAAGADVTLCWWLAVLYLGGALAWTLRRERRAGSGALPAPRAARGEALVWLASATVALFPLVAHRASPDDGYYVNVAVHAVDHPDAPVQRFDTLHGVPDLPLMYSVYRVHSFELLGALLARLTGLAAVEVFSWVLPVLFTLLMGLALARLVRLLVPEAWRWTFVVLLLYLVLEAEVPQSLGTFASFRMQQGKTALLFVALPLVTVYGAEFARQPSLRRWLLLAAAEVGAVGLSSTGLWLAPLVALFAGLAGMRPTRRGLRDLLLALLASAYVVALGLAHLRDALDESAPLRDQGAGVQLVAPGTPVITDGGELVEAAWRVVFGDGWLALLALVAMLATWGFCRGALARRVALVFPLATLFFLLDPYVALPVARGITGPQTYWRVLWALPLPVFVALLLTARVGAGRAARWAAWLVPLAVVPLVTGFKGFRPPIQWQLLGLKVHPEAFEHAQAIAREVPAGSFVLTPTHVGACLLQLHDYPFPLVAHRNWLVIQEARLGGVEGERRLRLLDYAEGLPQPQALLTQAIHDYDLRAVSFTRGLNAETIRGALKFLGFRNVHTTRLWETWVRP